MFLGLGVQERDRGAAHVVHDDPGEFAVRADLKSLLVWNVGDLQLHGYLPAGWLDGRRNHCSFGQKKNFKLRRRGAQPPRAGR
jgi:hypothetical protein